MKDSYPLTWMKIGETGLGRLKQREFGLKEGMVKCLEHVCNVEIRMYEEGRWKSEEVERILHEWMKQGEERKYDFANIMFSL